MDFFEEMARPEAQEAFDHALQAATKNARKLLNEQPVGTLGYTDYLQTNLWRRIRRRILKRDADVCICCHGKANMVHHLRYDDEVKAGNDDSGLVSVCDGCHAYCHYDELGRKRPIEEPYRVLQAGRTDTAFPTPRVDLRKSCRDYPPEWPRMSWIQRQGWHVEYARLSAEKRGKRKRVDKLTGRRFPSPQFRATDS